MASQITPYSAEPVDSEPVDTSRFEQIGGKLIERPVPILIHGELQFNVTSALRAALSGSGMRAVQEVSINHWDRPKSDWMTPDVIVSLAGGFQKAKNGHVLPPIVLAVEVLSPSQSFSNMQWKVKELIEWGVREVWLVDPDSSSVAAFDASDSLGRISSGTIEIADTGIEVPLLSLFKIE